MRSCLHLLPVTALLFASAATMAEEAAPGDTPAATTVTTTVTTTTTTTTTTGTAEQVALQQSQAAVKMLGTAMISAMEHSILTNGVSESVTFCHQQAQALTADRQPISGSVRRTALRWRNPANAPDEWEQEVMTSFIVRQERGESLAGMEHYQRFDTVSGPVLRYMKAIPTQQVCLHCHGSRISAAVSKQLAELYPQDQAVDFEPGQLRGAFSVTMPMQP